MDARTPPSPEPAPPVRRTARWVVLAAFAIAVVLIVPGQWLLRTGSEPADPVPEPSPGGYDWAAPSRHRPQPQGMSIGVTHTQGSIDHWGDRQALDSARNVLAATATYQNQHIFGWGALNPEPEPGRYEWESLDSRMDLIRATGGTPVITLAGAPDWMKGGEPGDTDWNRLEAPPLPEHYDAFADLAVAVAGRYPEVRHFQVWNELKGFWDEERERWDYESYTELYNTVYDALKRSDPGLAVGGPYVVVETWHSPDAGSHPSALSGPWGVVDQRSLDVLDYWLRHKQGADFIAVDAGMVTRDEGPLSKDARADSALFGAVTGWLRERSPLPVWWSEFHVGQADSDGQAWLVASVVTAVLHMAQQGASVALYWQPQRGVDEAHGVGPPAFWSSTEVPGGGRPLPLAEAMAWLQELLAEPVAEPVTWPAPEVGVLHGRTGFLAVNTTDREVVAQVRGESLHLAPYQVRYVPLPEGRP
jgi:hypothetical protein